MFPDEPLEPPLKKPHPTVLKVWRFSSFISTGVFLLLVLTLDLVISLSEASWPFPTGFPTLCAAVLFLPMAWYIPKLQYDRWRYAIRDEDVLVSYGVVWRTRRCLPRLRIQHVDITSGPIDRMLGLVHLSLYTAGAVGTVAKIPGLTPVEAETIRADLLATKVSSAA